MGEWTSSDGTRISYRRAGNGPGTILVHGGFIDGSSLVGLVAELASSRTAVAPDRRGHGDSSPYTSPHSFGDDVSDLVGLCRKLADELGDEVEFVGHSAGCHVALAAASTAPVSRVVLWEPPDFQAKRVSPELWERLHAAAAKGDRKAVVRLLLNDVIGANTGMHIPWFAFPFLYRSQFGKMMLANALAAATELAAFEDHKWRPENLAAITVPVYPLVGSTSPLFNRRFADFVAQHVPGTRVQIVEGGNHATPTDNPKTFAAVLTDLRQREPNTDQAQE